MEWPKSALQVAGAERGGHQRHDGDPDAQLWQDAGTPCQLFSGLAAPQAKVEPLAHAPLQHLGGIGTPPHLDDSTLADLSLFQAAGSTGLSHDYGEYPSRAVQPPPHLAPTLPTYFNGGPAAHPSGDYYREVIPSFGCADPTGLGVYPPATMQPVFTERTDDLGELPSDVNSMFAGQQVNSMLMPVPSILSRSPPASMIVARPRSFVGDTTSQPPVGAVSTPAAEQFLNEPSVALAVDSVAKFSPDRRKLCSIAGCKSQARAFNRCKRHGGSKRCAHPGCTKSVQSRGLCIRHGGGSRCQDPGCGRAAQSHGKCKMHGGGRPCMVEGCDKKAHLKRLCRKHGGGSKCSVPDCDKWAQRQGKCMTHSKEAVDEATTQVPGAVDEFGQIQV